MLLLLRELDVDDGPSTADVVVHRAIGLGLLGEGARRRHTSAAGHIRHERGRQTATVAGLDEQMVGACCVVGLELLERQVAILAIGVCFDYLEAAAFCLRAAAAAVDRVVR